MTDERKDQLTAEADGLIEGRNAVIEALRTEASIDKIFIQKGEVDKTLGHIASKARAAGIVVVEADRRKLDGMSRTHAHQGVIALAAVREYVSVDDILADAAAKNESPLIVVCDEISDPHNLGAIIRTAYCAGAHGVVIPKRRSAGLTSRGGQDLRRRGVSHEGGSGAQYPLLAEGPEKAGGLGIRHGGQRHHRPV